MHVHKTFKKCTNHHKLVFTKALLLDRYYARLPKEVLFLHHSTLDAFQHAFQLNEKESETDFQVKSLRPPGSQHCRISKKDFGSSPGLGVRSRPPSWKMYVINFLVPTWFWISSHAIPRFVSQSRLDRMLRLSFHCGRQADDRHSPECQHAFSCDAHL